MRKSILKIYNIAEDGPPIIDELYDLIGRVVKINTVVPVYSILSIVRRLFDTGDITLQPQSFSDKVLKIKYENEKWKDLEDPIRKDLVGNYIKSHRINDSISSRWIFVRSIKDDTYGKKSQRQLDEIRDYGKYFGIDRPLTRTDLYTISGWKMANVNGVSINAIDDDDEIVMCDNTNSTTGMPYIVGRISKIVVTETIKEIPTIIALSLPELLNSNASRIKSVQGDSFNEPELHPCYD